MWSAVFCVMIRCNKLTLLRMLWRKPLPSSYAVRMKAAGSSETSVTTYLTTRFHNLEY
jgi:hypothetical protein